MKITKNVDLTGLACSKYFNETINASTDITIIQSYRQLCAHEKGNDGNGSRLCGEDRCLLKVRYEELSKNVMLDVF